MNYDMIGPALVLGISSMGSAIGCSIAGSACHAVMARVEEGHGKFISMSAAPASQSIFGFILMLLMKNSIEAQKLSPLSAIGIGLSVGLALLSSSVFQAKACATAIQASARQPSVYGKSWAAIGIIESFALFAFVFALLLI